MDSSVVGRPRAAERARQRMRSLVRQPSSGVDKSRGGPSGAGTRRPPCRMYRGARGSARSSSPARPSSVDQAIQRLRVLRKLCGPMSKRKPSCSTVSMTPPKRAAALEQAARADSACRKRHAQARPEIPPPMTRILGGGGHGDAAALERLREEGLFGEALLLEIRIEEHGHVADEDAAEQRDANFVRRELDEADPRRTAAGARVPARSSRRN